MNIYINIYNIYIYIIFQIKHKSRFTLVKVLSHTKGLTKKGFCSLRLTETFWLIKYV